MANSEHILQLTGEELDAKLEKIDDAVMTFNERPGPDITPEANDYDDSQIALKAPFPNQPTFQNSRAVFSYLLTKMSAVLSMIADEFDPEAEEPYKKGSFVLKDAVLYECIVQHTGAWNASHFQEFLISDGLGAKDKVEEMPTASADEVGKMYQYIGTTTSNYIYGYFYRCFENASTNPSTYYWANVEVQNGTVSRRLTQQEYDNLSEAEINSDIVFYIYDSEIFKSNNATCGYTPIGTIIAVMGSEAPNNYLACNGQVVNISKYPELAEYFKQQFGSKNYFGGDGTTTFALPDLRGEFLRGTGTNSHANQGSGATKAGTHQDATAYNYGWANNVAAGFSRTDPTSSTYYDFIKTLNFDKTFNNGTRSSILYSSSMKMVSNTSGDQEWLGSVRPTNTSVLYCIAVRNICIDAKYNYSTEPIAIGTWIDGRTIYQITIENTFPNVTTNGTNVIKEIPLNIDNFSEIIYMEGIVSFLMSGVYEALTLTYVSNAGYQAKMYWYNKSLYLSSSSKDYNGAKTYITIRYLLTED